MKRFVAITAAVFFLTFLAFVILFTGRLPLSAFSPDFYRMGMFDWPIFVEAASGFIKSGVLYHADSNLYAPNAAIYKFPPLYASTLIPMLSAGVSEMNLKYAMGLTHLILYLLSVVICLSLAQRENKGSFYACIFFVIATFEPFVDNFIGLQLEIFILFLICVCMFLLTKRKPVLAGMALGVATAFKLYPVFFCLYFVFKKQYRGLYGIVLGFLFATFYTLMVVGYDQHVLYYTRIMPVILIEPLYTSHQNISINNLLYYSGMSEIYSVFSGYFVFLLGLIFLCFTQFRAKNSDSIKIKDEVVPTLFSVLISLFVLAAKNSWGNYQLLLIVPMITLLGFSFGKKYSDLASLLAVGFACALIFFAQPHRLHFVYDHFLMDYQPPEHAFVFMRTLAGLIIFLFSCRLHYRVMAKYAFDPVLSHTAE